MDETKDPEVKHPCVSKNADKSKKKPFICKFYVKGTCRKEDKCEYIHDKENLLVQQHECPYFSQGYCTNTNLCKFKHTSKGEEDCPEILPLWFIEFVMNKPSHHIFEEAEKYLEEETLEIRQRVLQNETPIFMKPKLIKDENYISKQDQLCNFLDNTKIRFFIVSQENSIISLYSQYSVVYVKSPLKLKEAKDSCEEVVLILFNSSFFHFVGFVQMIGNQEIIEFEGIKKPQGFSCFFQTKWLWEWRTINQKVNSIRNPMANHKRLFENEDLQELTPHIGLTICKYMMKKLTKEETVQFFSSYLKAPDSTQESQVSDNLQSRSNPISENLNDNMIISDKKIECDFIDNSIYYNNDYNDVFNNTMSGLDDLRQKQTHNFLADNFYNEIQRNFSRSHNSQRKFDDEDAIDRTISLNCAKDDKKKIKIDLDMLSKKRQKNEEKYICRKSKERSTGGESLESDSDKCVVLKSTSSEDSKRKGVRYEENKYQRNRKFHQNSDNIIPNKLFFSALEKAAIGFKRTSNHRDYKDK